MNELYKSLKFIEPAQFGSRKFIGVSDKLFDRNEINDDDVGLWLCELTYRFAARERHEGVVNG